MQGPDESVSKLFLVEREGENSHEVSAAVAQFLRLSDAECNAILRLYCEEEEREVQIIKNKYITILLKFICMIAIIFCLFLDIKSSNGASKNEWRN